MKKSLMIGGLSVLTSLLLIGCGGGSTASVASDGTSTGTFVDAEVVGAEYNTSSGITGTTDAQGHFRYRAGDKVEFHLGKLILGAGEPNNGGLITPKELTDDNATITLLLQTLQSLDADNNTSNGIQIPDTLLTDLEDLNDTHHIEDLDATSLLSLDDDLKAHLDEDNDGSLDVNETEAHEHFVESENKWKSEHEADHSNSKNAGQEQGSDNGHGQGKGNGNGQGKGKGQHGDGQNGENGQNHGENNNTQTGPVVDVNDYYTYNLTQEVKNEIAYMGNEERLAYDVYKNLYEYYNDTNLTVLNNIADKSEKRHIATMRALVDKYDLNATDLTIIDREVVGDINTDIDSVRGQYDIQHIKDLYDALYNMGIQSKENALKVGCMVEVTDIIDLDTEIQEVQAISAKDVEDAFTALRKGSYNHYWAFDKALKSMGVTDGCCSLGTIDGVNYCHTEYPQNEH